MAREAPRTLFTLSTGFQRGVSAADYEVLAVDVGSTEPLDPDAMAAFGPHFRLLRAPAAPSPAAAMNHAVQEARGGAIAVCIDGARDSPLATSNVRSWRPGAIMTRPSSCGGMSRPISTPGCSGPLQQSPSGQGDGGRPCLRLGEEEDEYMDPRLPSPEPPHRAGGGRGTPTGLSPPAPSAPGTRPAPRASPPGRAR